MSIPNAGRVGWAASLLAVGLLLIGAGPGRASPVAGATYSGTYDGGKVAFDVADNGMELTYFGVETNDRVPCSDMTALPALPINDDGFSGIFGPELFLAGSFPGPRSAEGTFAFDPTPRRRLPAACPLGTVSWSAVVDTKAPRLRLGSARQSGNARSVVIEAECPAETCEMVAKGTVQVAGTPVRRFKLKKAIRGALDKLTLELGVSREARRAIRQALRAGRKVTADVTVTARDRAGNAESKRRTARLTR